MYEKHFGLTRHPFGKDIETDDLFPSTSLRELEVRLAHLVELRGIGLVTGESGSGKTTACRKATAALHAGLHRVLYVPMSTGNAMDLYKTIAWELGLPTERNRAGLYRQIRTEVTRLCQGTEPAAPRGTAFVSDLTFTYAANYWGLVERDHSVGERRSGDGRTLSIGGRRHAKGWGPMRRATFGSA